MENDDQEDAWRKLVTASKAVGAGQTEGDVSASKSFVSSVRNARQALWKFAKVLLWRRLSIVAIIVAAILYLLAHLFLKKEDSPSIDIPEPPTPLSS